MADMDELVGIWKPISDRIDTVRNRGDLDKAISCHPIVCVWVGDKIGDNN